MANTKLTGLTANTTPAIADLFYMVDDPSGSPLSQKITFENYLKIINGLTTDSSPVRTADYVATYDASASGPKKVLLGKAAPYILTLTTANAANDPADATTYHFGYFPNTAISTTLTDLYKMYIPMAGTITKAEVLCGSFGAYGTSETSTLSLRLNNTSDTTLTAVLTNNAIFRAAVTGLSIAVVAGDYITCKWVTPTWVTNPTDVFFIIQVIVE